MRQIYQACVTPIIDYGSTVWHDPLKDGMHFRALNRVQRDALLRVLTAFKNVATQTLEVETYVPSTALRFKRRGQDVAASLFTLPKDPPIWDALERACRRAVAKGDAARLPLAQVIKTISIEQLRALETIEMRPLHPWRESSASWIDIHGDRYQAKELVAKLALTPTTVVYTDASSRSSNVGGAAVTLNDRGTGQAVWQGSIGPAKRWTVHSAELIAISQAALWIQSEHVGDDQTYSRQQQTFTIVSDCKSALQVRTASYSKSTKTIRPTGDIQNTGNSHISSGSQHQIEAPLGSLTLRHPW